MSFFKKIKKAVKNSFKILTNPKKMIDLKTDLLTPSKKPTLDNLFKKLDPVLDVLDPMHNVVQEWTTGSATTEGQSPYFQKIAPMIVDYFLPGVGSAAGAVSSAADKNWKGAIVYAGSSYAQGFGQFTSVTPNSTPAGYSASDLGGGISLNSGGSGLTAFGESGALGTGVKGNMFSGFDIAGVSSGISNSAVIGFDETDLGKGITGLSYTEAAKVGATPLTAGAVRAGLKYANLGADLYAMRTADGQTLATYGNQPRELSVNINYQMDPVQHLGLIPTVAAQDEKAVMNKSIANSQAKQTEQMLMIAGAALAFFYLFKRG